MNSISNKNKKNAHQPIHQKQLVGWFGITGFLQSPLPALALSGRVMAAGLVASFCFMGCAGPAQTSQSEPTVQTAPAATPSPAVGVGANSTADDTKSITWNQALRQKKVWYASAEAARIADNLLVYQRDNGGWNKNTDMAKPLTEAERTELNAAAEKGAVSTIDNKSTFTQMEYLARVHAATGQDKYKEGFLKGMDYLLEAQYDNGGWPQFYPIRKGYYEHITYNDGAMIGVMELLREVAQGKEPYTFVDPTRKEQAAKAIEKGVDVILKTQIKVDGNLTAWCAQHDRNDFSPQKARAYELPSISGGESIGILEYLMDIENPSPAVIRAVEGAVSWMNQVKITGIRLDRVENPAFNKGHDRVVVQDPSAPPLLARFYEIGTNRPMFVGRDGIVRKTLAEIEQERRSGYSWYINFPVKLLDEEYAKWKQEWVAKK